MATIPAVSRAQVTSKQGATATIVYTKEEFRHNSNKPSGGVVAKAAEVIVEQHGLGQDDNVSVFLGNKQTFCNGNRCHDHFEGQAIKLKYAGVDDRGVRRFSAPVPKDMVLEASGFHEGEAGTTTCAQQLAILIEKKDRHGNVIIREWQADPMQKEDLTKYNHGNHDFNLDLIKAP